MTILYQQLATEIIGQIESGIYTVGEKLPGVRALSVQRGISPGTVVEAYQILCDSGFIESRSRSGFYIRPRMYGDLGAPAMTQPKLAPKTVIGQELVLQLAQLSSKQTVVNLGAAVPDLSIIPTNMIEKSLTASARLARLSVCGYEFSPGNIELRRLIAKRMSQWGCPTHAEDIVITNGCQEALYLVLKTMTQPGDAIAIESPAYYGLLQIIENLQLKAIEIPTDSREGMSLDALQLAIEQWQIRACLLVSNFSNPLGAVMGDDKKRAFTQLCKKAKVALIEDDIYGDLSFSAQRPNVFKHFDANVIYCSSFSKSLAPGLRIGWVASRQLASAITQLKFTLNSGSPSIVQIAMADILASGKFDRHLRATRSKLAKSMYDMIVAIKRYFPEGTRITQPQGGMVLWVELPVSKTHTLDTFNLALRTLEDNIAIAPGKLFSAVQKYQHCLRLSSGGCWTAQKEKALKRLGGHIKLFINAK